MLDVVTEVTAIVPPSPPFSRWMRHFNYVELEMEMNSEALWTRDKWLPFLELIVDSRHRNFGVCSSGCLRSALSQPMIVRTISAMVIGCLQIQRRTIKVKRENNAGQRTNESTMKDIPSFWWTPKREWPRKPSHWTDDLIFGSIRICWILIANNYRIRIL